MDFLSKKLNSPTGEVENGRTATAHNILEGIDEYLENEGVSSEDRSEAIDVVKTVLSKEERSVAYDKDDLSAMQASFLLALEVILTNDYEFETSLVLIDTLEMNASVLLPEEEIGFILMNISTAREQITYWYNNIGEWEVTLPNGRTKCVKSWKKVGKKAISIGLGASAGCGVLAYFGPFGWKGWGVCTFAGFVGGAVEEAADQCLGGDEDDKKGQEVEDQQKGKKGPRFAYCSIWCNNKWSMSTT